jgi:hypothetical protein
VTTPGVPTTAPTSQSRPPSARIATGPVAPSAASHHRSSAPAVLITVLSIVGAAVVWVIGLAVMAWAARSRRRRNARSPTARVTLAWSFAREALAGAGLPPRPWETPTEVGDRVARSSFPADGVAAVAALAELEERASYSAGGPFQGDAEAADAAAEKVRRAARVAGRRKEVLGIFDPRAVVRSVRVARAEARAASAVDQVQGPSA